MNVLSFSFFSGHVVRRKRKVCIPCYRQVIAEVLPSAFLVNRAAPISISLAIGTDSYETILNATGWASGSTVCFSPMLFPKVLNAKQGNCIYHFLNLCYDLTGCQNRSTAYKGSIQTDRRGLLQ